MMGEMEKIIKEIALYKEHKKHKKWKEEWKKRVEEARE